MGGTWRKFQKLISSPGTLPSLPLLLSTPAPGFVDVAADGCKLTLSSPSTTPISKLFILLQIHLGFQSPPSPSPTSCPLATWRSRRQLRIFLRLKAVNTLLDIAVNFVSLCLSLISLSHTHNCIYNFKGLAISMKPSQKLGLRRILL